MLKRQANKAFNNFFCDLQLFHSNSQQSLKKAILQVLDNQAVKVIEQTNTPASLVVFKVSNKNFIAKFEYNTPPITTQKEINWYLSLKRNFEFVPQFYNYFLNERLAIYIFEYFDNCFTLDNIILEKLLSPTEAKKIFKKLLKIPKQLFFSSSRRKVNLPEADKLYLEKIKSRNQEALRFPFLKKLFTFKEIVINNKLYPNISHYQKIISKNVLLHRYLTSREWGLTHGDLCFDNILIQDKKIKLVDPNGDLEMPIEYDLGKLLHSIHGGYELIHKDKFTIRKIRQNKYDFQIKTIPVYQKLFDFFQNTQATEVVARALYSEACHFSTMLPHHASDERETTALFLRAVQLFYELFNKFLA